MSNLESRIVALEKANRRWRTAACVVGAALLIGTMSAADAPDTVPDVLQAKRIEVLAPNGEPAIVLQANAHRSALSLSARGSSQHRSIDLSADQDGARLTLMKNKEAPLLSAEVDDAGSTLALFDGRQPSQLPRSIVLRSSCPAENKEGGATTIMLTRLHAKSPVGAILSVRDPDDKTSLMLGGVGAKNVTLRVNPEDGKLDFLGDPDELREKKRP